VSVRYLELHDVLALHDTLMRRLGTSPASLRAGGLELLESAVLRPQMAAHYADVDLAQQAALLAVGISQAQAFLDGNKRTAALAAVVFLRLNSRRIEAGQEMALAHRLQASAEVSGENREAATVELRDWLRFVSTQD
jgi:death on curing protein